MSPFAPRMKEVQIDLKGVSVMIGMPAGRDLPVLTVKSLLATQDLCRHVKVPFQIGMVAGSAVVQWARDEVVDLFLKSDATRLFWIDSDMVWEAEQFMRLLALSQHVDVLCAAYTAKLDQPTFYVNWDTGNGMEPGPFDLLSIEGIGLGFAVMTRKVVEEIAQKAPRVFDDISGRDMASVFRIDQTHNGRRRGEDMAFFYDIRQLGYKVWMDPSVDLGHVGSKVYTGSIKDALE